MLRRDDTGAQVQLTRFSDELPALVCHWHFDEAHRASPRFRFTTETAHLGFVTSPGRGAEGSKRVAGASLGVFR